MSGFSSVTPSGYQAVSNYPGGMGFGGMGTGFGIDALLILLLLGGGNGFGGWGRNGGPAANAVASDVVLQPAFQSLQQQISGLQGQFSATQMSEQVSGVGDQVNAGTTNILQGQGAIRTDLQNANFQTLNSVNGLGRDITAQNTQTLIQSLNQFTNLNSNLTNLINGLNLSNLTSFQTVNGGINQLSRDMAECCCEIKSTIRDSSDVTRAEGAATRALINDIQMNNLQTQLADAKAQISNLNQTNALIANNATQTSTILTHLLPFFGVAGPTAATADRRVA